MKIRQLKHFPPRGAEGVWMLAQTLRETRESLRVLFFHFNHLDAGINMPKLILGPDCDAMCSHS